MKKLGAEQDALISISRKLAKLQRDYLALLLFGAGRPGSA